MVFLKFKKFYISFNLTGCSLVFPFIVQKRESAKGSKVQKWICGTMWSLEFSHFKEYFLILHYRGRMGVIGPFLRKEAEKIQQNHSKQREKIRRNRVKEKRKCRLVV